VGGLSGATGAKKTTASGSGDAKALQSEINDMKMNMETLEKERDFYFAKLRDIETFI